jgi:ribosome modulation factor
MSATGRLERCFQQGVEAREGGRKPVDNPYDIETDEHREWAAGWSATLDLDEEDDPTSTRIDAGPDDDPVSLDASIDQPTKRR